MKELIYLPESHNSLSILAYIYTALRCAASPAILPFCTCVCVYVCMLYAPVYIPSARALHLRAAFYTLYTLCRARRNIYKILLYIYIYAAETGERETSQDRERIRRKAARVKVLCMCNAQTPSRERESKMFNASH